MEYLSFKSSNKINKKPSKLIFGTRHFDKLINSDNLKAERIINSVFNQGINFIITAQHYDNGLTESFLGNNFSEIRDDIIIGTSGGIIQSPSGPKIDLSKKTLNQQITDILSRLQSDYIDLFQLHHDDIFVDVKSTSKFLNELLESDIIKAIGITNFRKSRIEEWLTYLPIHTIQFPYNFLQQNSLDYFGNLCKSNNIDILPHSIFANGLITNADLGKNEIFPYLKISVQNQIYQIRKEFELLFGKLNIPYNKLVLKWLQNSAEISFILFSTQSTEHLSSNLKDLESKILAEEISQINNFSNKAKALMKESLLLPIEVNEIIKKDKKHFTKFFGTLIEIPESVSTGDTIYIDDTTGEIIL